MHIFIGSACLGRPSSSIRSMPIISVMDEGVSAVIHGFTTVHTYRTMVE